MAVVVAAATILIPGIPAYGATMARNAGVPPTALNDCENYNPANGGWLIRDVVSTGTSSTDTTPVRPRSARFAEPCFDDDGSGDLKIPVTLTDIPVDGTAEEAPPDGLCNEYSQSEVNSLAAPPGANSGANSYVKAAYYATYACETMIAYEVNNNAGNYPAYATPTRSITVSVTGQVITVSYSALSGGPATTDDNPEVAVNAYCSLNSTGQIVNQGGGTISGSAGAGSNNYTCSTGRTPYAVVVHRDTALGPLPAYYGTAWKTGTPLPSGPQSGTGYYGGTQAAHFAFLAGPTYFGTADEGEITCSNSYDGSSPFTFGIAETTSISGLDPTIDTRGTPPILSGDIAVEWSATTSTTPNASIEGTDCPYLLSVRIWVCAFTGNSPSEFGCVEQEWDSERYRTNTPYQGTDAEDPEQLICLVNPQFPGCYEVLNPPIGEDSPIVCTIEASGDFFIWIIVWVTQVPSWVACMLIPVGWDRSDKIAREWEAGVGGATEALVDSLPDGLSCGVIGTIPFEGTSIDVNTCVADLAPAWAKSAVAYVIILGLLALGIRRVLWAIGGDSSK